DGVAKLVDSLVRSSVRKNPGLTIVVWMPNGSTSGASDSIQPSTPNFDAASAVPSASRTASGLRPVATTLWPAASAALANSTPMPRPAPVMNHVLLLLIDAASLCLE